MVKYILKRLLQAIPTFLVITFAVFMLSNAAPGSPVDIIKSAGDLTPEAEQQMREYYGLDQPVLVRYAKWLGGLARGDMGISTRTNQPVWRLIKDRIGPTLTLTLTSLVASLLIAIPLGIMAALKPYSIWDTTSSILAFFGASTPNFFVALICLYFFSVKLGVLPAMGMYSGNGGGLGDLALHLVLPVAVTVLRMSGSYIKQTRGAMLDVMNEEYVKTARAKGLGEGSVVIRHILRNALIPIVSCVGLNIPYLVGGSTVTEQIFGWPGMGSLLILSISQRDYNTIMGITVLIAAAVLLATLVVDILYAYLDPKIRFD